MIGAGAGADAGARAPGRILLAVALGAALAVVPALTPAPTLARPAAAAPAHRLLITGDSITQGSVGDYTWRYRLWKKLSSTAPGVSFVGPRTGLYDYVRSRQVAGGYAIDFPGKAHGALWGTTFIDQLPQVADQVEGSAPDTMVVLLGFNDLSYHTDPAQTIAHARRYIERARAAAPGLDVVIGEVTDWYDIFAHKYKLVGRAKDYARRLQALADEMDTSRERVVVAHTRSGWDPRVDTWDGVHPNSTGETILAQRVSEALATIGIGTRSPDIIARTRWGVRGPRPGVAAGAERATLSWSRVSTGSTAMFIDYQVPRVSHDWKRLPYAVAKTDSWTMSPLIAGTDYRFRLAPSKGLMTGLPGRSRTGAITAERFGEVPSVTVAADGRTPKGAARLTMRWRAADNAGGYKLRYRMNATALGRWSELPYPVDASSRRWTLEPMYPGRYYQVGVRPVRGFVEHAWRKSGRARTVGLAPSRFYAALGDSYSSGLGSDSTSGGYTLNKPCYRTKNAWAFSMQPDYQSITTLLACQGDTLTTGIDGGVDAEVDRADTAFHRYATLPAIVTVTVGGNDVGFADKLKRCVESDCATYSRAWSRDVAGVEPALEAFYSRLRARFPDADIVVGGYPSVVQVGGKSNNAICRAISGDERTMVTSLAHQLNVEIARAAKRAHVWSVGTRVAEEMAGHNACANGDGEWINSLDFDLGGEMGFIGKNSFHPKVAGQAAYARAFAATVSARANP